MSVTVTVNNTTYTIPQTNETGWDVQVTSWIQQVSSSCLQISGGAFTFTADLDTGATYGFKSAYFKSRSTNIAATGVVRFASAESLVWRNNANSGDLALTTDSSDNLLYNSNKILKNDQNIVIGTNGTANNNVRINRSGSSKIELVLGGDSTAEGSDSSSIAQLAFALEQYATASIPAAATARKSQIVFDTSLSKIKYCDGSAWQTVSANSYTAPNVHVYTSGSNTYTPTAGVLYTRFLMVGAGGGGGAANTNAGSAGNDTTVSDGTNTNTAGKGSGGANGAGQGGNGGTNTLNVGTLIRNIAGGKGQAGANTSATVNTAGGQGGNSSMGGAGAGASSGQAGSDAAANSGSGGGGGTVGSSASGAGGGAGGTLEFIITSLAASYTCVVGAGGAGGTAGGAAGGAGAAGIIIVTEYFQ